MPDDLPAIQSPVPSVSRFQHVVTTLLILGFMAVGWLRLNDCDLFNPDSPRYLIYGQSIAATGEYRAIDTPGAPLYTWRPPGLPMLLAPVLLFRPYDIVAAKCVVLALGALLLLTVAMLSNSLRPGWTSPLIVAIVGSSPMFLAMSTEVLTEVPYALGTLLVLYWVGHWQQMSEGQRFGMFAGVLVVLPFVPVIRTIGVALVAAVGLWSLINRQRWRLLASVAFAVASLACLAWRSRMVSGNNYAGSLLQSIREHGLLSVIANAWNTVLFYGSALPGVVLPGLTGDQPFYAPMVIGPVPALSGDTGLASVAAFAVVILGLAGMWHQRSRNGLPALLYLPLYCGCLAIWPWRHERFLWPLVPMVWAFVPTGCMLIASAIPLRAISLIKPIAVIAILAQCVWQLQGDFALVSTNQRLLADRDQFYRTDAPGFYFSDWRKAGDWIRENTPAHGRLLAWQAAVGETAHRYQRRAQFEALSPDKVHQQIAGFSSRYLVVADCQFGVGFGWQQVFADPAYKLNIVYRDRNVAVLEVEPNRTGKVSRTAFTEWIANQRAALDEVLLRLPNRPDLMTRKADLLQMEGKNSEAIALLEGLVGKGVVTVRVCSSLGWLHFAEANYGLAERYLDMARGLPNAEPVAESLANGVRLARQRLRDPQANPATRNAQSFVQQIKDLVSNLDLANAEQECDRALKLFPDHPVLLYWRGYLHHLFDETDQAEPLYVRASERGSEEARGKLLLLQMLKAIEQPSASVVNAAGSSEPVDPDIFGSHVRLAKLLDEHGWSGRAVAVLESVRTRFGDRPEILSALADLYLRFARPEDAAPLYRLAQQSWPHEKSLQQGLSAAEASLRTPRF